MPREAESRRELLDCGLGRMPWCVQFWYSDRYLRQRHGQEDCLHLKIIVPSPQALSPPCANAFQSTKLLPVLVWIHGGSYQINGANMYPVDGAVRNFVSRGMIFIAINYRLGPLGKGNMDFLYQNQDS
jgi:carboxylesterase type B